MILCFSKYSCSVLLIIVSQFFLQVFGKEVVFLVDISGSMRGAPLDSVKTALLASLYKLNPSDTFNIVAFNESYVSFSPSLVQATKETIEEASEWIEAKFVADGGTNISAPLNQVFMKFVISYQKHAIIQFLVLESYFD